MVIERRLTAVAAAGLALALYNPRSATRTAQLKRVLAVLGAHREPATPVGVVADATRAGERVERTTLAELDRAVVDMRTLLLVAGDTATEAGPWLVADRGAT